MRNWMMAAALAAALASACASKVETTPVAATKPNFLVIVADDLGFSDIGAFGGEIATPNLDAVARSGLRLTDFHTAPLCAPTRAMLMSGLDSHKVGLGNMAELMTPRQPPFLRLAAGRPGYEGYLRPEVVTIAERLSALGYFTAISGKWHLGWEEGQSPRAQGFAKSFVLLDGRQNHFGADQTAAWRTYNAQSSYREDGAEAQFPVGQYSSKVFTDRMVDYLSGADPQKPFFAVLTYTQPHWPLQAPPEEIARYRGKYDNGPGALRMRRLEGMQREGITNSTVPSLVPTYEWDGATPERRAALARSMEVYAAMVSSMDHEVGRVLDHLRKSNQLNNTYVIFLSDNGADGADLTGPVELRGLDIPPELRIDNSLDNIGRASSFMAYGPDWAQAAMGPSRLIKGHVWTGGVHSPAFVSGPGVKGGISSAFAHVTDIPATMFALAAGAGDLSATGMTGRTLQPLFADPSREIRGNQDTIGWEQNYARAIRKGDWRAVFAPTDLNWIFPLDEATLKWRLFNVAQDPGETQDLAAQEPERLNALVAEWAAYARDAAVFVPDPLMPSLSPAP